MIINDLPEIRIGALPGQVVLGIEIPDSKTEEYAAKLKELGYNAHFCCIRKPEGLVLFARLANDWVYDQVPEDYLVDQWEYLKTQFPPDSVRFWRGLEQKPEEAS